MVQERKNYCIDIKIFLKRLQFKFCLVKYFKTTIVCQFFMKGVSKLFFYEGPNSIIGLDKINYF